MKAWVTALVGCALSLAVGGEAHAKTFKMGALAPHTDPLATPLETWASTVDQKSASHAQIAWSWNGTAGDEAQMAVSMKTGQLDGAMLTEAGLRAIDPDFEVLSLPGLFATRAKFEAALVEMTPLFRTHLASKGLTLIGVIELGTRRAMSVGTIQLTTPEKLRSGVTAITNHDVIVEKLVAGVPGAKAQGLLASDVFGALGPKVQIVFAPALTAEALLWSNKITQVQDASFGVGFTYGALVMAKPVFDGQLEDVRNLLAQSGALAAAAASFRMTGLDDQAFSRMTSKTSVVTPDRAAWATVFDATRKAVLATYSLDTRERLERVLTATR